MCQKVLVQFDSSELAECALPEVKELAQGGMVREVILLSVVEIPTLNVGEGIDYSTLKRSRHKRLEEYLENIRSQVGSEGVAVRTEVREGDAAEKDPRTRVKPFLLRFLFFP